jgi:hypothetical protein
MSESQKVTQQEALTTASGRTWLIVGGVIALLCLVFLWAMRDLPPLGVATAGIVVTIVLYLAMVAVRFGVIRPRVKLVLLAILTITIALAFVAAAGTVILSSS